MRCRNVIVWTSFLLIASFCGSQTQAHPSDTQTLATGAQVTDAKLYSQVIQVEMKAEGLGQHNTVCLALPQYADPSKSLLKALKSDGVTVHKPHRCLFRGYEIRVEQRAPDSMHVQLVDVRYADTDLAVILRDGVYLIEKDATGDWHVRDYKPIQHSEKP